MFIIITWLIDGSLAFAVCFIAYASARDARAAPALPLGLFRQFFDFLRSSGIAALLFRFCWLGAGEGVRECRSRGGKGGTPAAFLTTGEGACAR